MATIKVIYNSIVRRFNIDPSTTWDVLETKLRSLYDIPTTTSLIVSYTDEDDDIITLSSDLELKEVLSQESSGRPIKFVLNTVNSGEDFQQNQEQREDENVESRPKHVSISEEEEEEEPEYDQSTPLLNKEKEKESEKQHSEKTKDTKTQPEKEEDDDDDEFIFVMSNPWTRSSFFGPGFGLFDGSHSGLFGHYPFSPFGRSQCHRPPFFGGPSVYYFGSGPNECGQKFNSCNGSSKPFCFSKSAFYDKNTEASTSAAAQSAKNNRCDKNKCNPNSGPSCGRNFNFFHPRYYNQSPFNQEQLDDKLSTLHSLGFDPSNNTLYEDLLKRYNGNLERVIDLLLRNQQANDHFDNETSTKKQNGIVINEEKARNVKNDEIKQVDNEEDKP